MRGASASREKRGRGGRGLSPFPPRFVSFPNLHNINSSAPRISGTKTDYSKSTACVDVLSAVSC